MQIFLIIMNLILVWVIINKGKEIKDLEHKTLDAYRNVSDNVKTKKEEEKEL